MGLGHDETKNTTYLEIIGGKLAKKVDAHTDGAVSRTNKNGVVVHELLFDTLTALLVDIFTWEGEYGKMWKLKFKDHEAGNDENYIVNIPYKSGYFDGFVKRIEAVDLSKPIKISPYLIANEEGIDRAFFGIWQGKKIESLYTKDNQYTHNNRKLPELKQTTVNNEVVWDSTERMLFYENIISAIQSDLHTLHSNADTESGLGNNTFTDTEMNSPAVLTPTVTSAPPKDEEGNDLPF